jgi:Putative regulator of cell autolysis
VYELEGFQFTKKLSLKNKLLLLFFITVVIPLFIIIEITIKMLSDQIVKQTTHIYHESVQQTVSNLKEMLMQYVDVSNRYSFDSKLKTYLDIDRNYSSESEILSIYEDYLRPFRNYDKMTRPTYTDIKVYYLNPTLIQDYDTYVFADEQIQSQKPFITGKKADGKLAWGINDNNIFSSRMVKYFDDSNNFFIVSIFIEKAKLHTLINQDAETGTNIIISDENGSVITTSNNKPFDTSIAKKGYYNQLMTLTESGFTDSDGTKYRIISIPLSRYNIKSLPDWRVSALIPINMMLADEEKIKNIVYIICLSCFALSSILFLMFMQKIVNRLKKLINKMDAINIKEFSIIKDDGNQDELGLLTRIFNGMVINLQKLIYENYESNLKLKDMALKKREAEFYALQSQIHPHFLFNTLESLRMGLVDNSDEENATLVTNLSNLLRKSLSWSGEIISINDEIEFTRNYLEIQKFRFTDKLNYKIELPQALRDYSIPKLTIQPIVENAVLHGVEPKWGDCIINITVGKENNSIIIRVTDDGIGMDENTLKTIKQSLAYGSEMKKGTSIGLRNINDRIHLNFGEEYGIDIISSKISGTSVTIKIPYLKK